MATSFEELVYRQDLNEVFLLLDFISGRPDKRLSDLDNKIAGSHKGDKLRSPEIIARVSRMRYPLHAENGERAKEAALLLKMKDWLNWMAYRSTLRGRLKARPPNLPGEISRAKVRWSCRALGTGVRYPNSATSRVSAAFRTMIPIISRF